MVYSVIDIGSTSVRLLLSDKGKNTKYINTTKLAEGMMKSGCLSADAIERTAQAVSEFCKTAENAGAAAPFIFATQAVRAAVNRKVFMARVKDFCGIDVEILSKETEAELGFLGAYRGGRALVVDMGGASTEISVGTKRGIEYSHSLPYGIVTLTEIEKERGVNLSEFCREIVCEYGQIPPFDSVTAIGGTGGTIVSVLEKMEQYNPMQVNGYYVSAAQVDKLYSKLSRLTHDERLAVKGLPAARADIIISGLCLYGVILKKLKAEGFTVSENDNTEGYLIKKGLLKA